MPPAAAASLAANDRRFAASICLMLLIAWVRLVPVTGEAGQSTWKDHAGPAVFLLSSIAVGIFACMPDYEPRWRHWVVAAYRLALFSSFDIDRAIHTNLMRKLPMPGVLGVLVDVVHLILGSQSVKLFLFSVFLPLPLPAHLAVHTLCLLWAMPPLKNHCLEALLNNPLAQERIAIFHAIMRVGTLGVVPPDFPTADQQCRCAAAVAFAPIVIGWLVPTFLVARSDYKAVWHCQRGRYNRAAAPAGPAVHTGSAPAVRTHEASCRDNLESCTAAVGRTARLAKWLLENAFLQGSPFELQMVGWFILLDLCWLLAALCAATLGKACS